MAGKLASQVRGLSEAQFREADGTEEQCRAVWRSCAGRLASSARSAVAVRARD